MRAVLRLWILSGVATAAFADQPQTRAQWPIARRGCLRAMVLLSLVVSERRVHCSGKALCLLVEDGKGHPLREVALAVGGLGVLAVLVTEVPWLFWLIVGLLLVFLGPQLVTSLRVRRLNSSLRRWRPESRYVGVHTVASVRSGAGRELMSELNREADVKGWTLVVDAANEALVRYYGALGYMAVSDPVRMPWGESTVRMARRPAELEVEA